MQAQVPPPAQVPRLEGRSLTAAGLCIMALFFDVLGWLLAIAGIVLLRRAVFSRQVKWLLAAIALGPKLLFVGVRALNAPPGLSFTIEPRTLATSPSLWAWCVAAAAFGVYLIFLPRSSPQASNAPVEPASRRPLLFAALGLGLIAVAAFVLLGLIDGFHRIDEAAGGRWALRHAARGNVATFTGNELASIDATEHYGSRSGRSYEIRVALAGGRSYSVTTKDALALDELRKFATTANLPEGKVRILRRNGTRWINGAGGIGLKDVTGTYLAVDERNRSRSTVEFWLDGDRLAGREMLADPAGRHVRMLRNIKVSDSGGVEFQPAAYVEASQQEKQGTLSVSFAWSSDPETGRFVKNGLELGPRKYTKQ